MTDQQLWDAFVEAQGELNRRQAEFYQNATNRTEILRAALNEGGWQQATALGYLTSLSDDGADLLPQLVELSLSHSQALAARRAINRVPRQRLWPQLESLVLGKLDTADDDDYRRFAELLAHVKAWPLLERLVLRARSSDNPDVCEVADDFSEWYGPMWSRKP
ncbi:hypothetical protein [Nocardia aurantiaca]|uniref:Uncharacterized protein n=1 Tax=Nocardia aurantiaca TaxID=2675850 RepID=A0A6I3L7L5_9NOCA|nr:hypothetical protein [Nocardia aurantiaca]MTE17531.1 hypothetical protein [Nocardia aurantiaca]